MNNTKYFNKQNYILNLLLYHFKKQFFKFFLQLKPIFYFRSKINIKITHDIGMFILKVSIVLC